MDNEILKKMNDLLTRFGKNKINNIDEWKKIEFTTKKQIQNIKVPKNTLEIRGTSGSTGESLFIYFSKEAINGFVNRTKQCIKSMKLNDEDTGLILFSYGNFVVSSMIERACRMQNISLIPFGSSSTYKKELMVELIKKFKPTVWFSTPSYALKLMSELSHKKYYPSKILVGGEKLLDSYISNFQKSDIEVYNLYGLSECNPVGFSNSKNPKIINAQYSNIYYETITTKCGDELIVTDFTNTATPIIRYRTGDIITNIKKNAKNDIIKFEIVSRNDDLIKIRGAFVSKTKIIEILSKHTLDFVIEIVTKDVSDLIEIILPEYLRNKKDMIVRDLSMILNIKIFKLNFIKDVVVPKTNTNKPKYFIDLRK